MNWTSADVLQLAPDGASAKAGQGLASPAKWQEVAIQEHIIWGLCKGSGQDPYRVQVDTEAPAFKCSCPSRKTPCKHVLGILWLWIGQPQRFEGATPPWWVAEWISARARATTKATRPTGSPNSGSSATRLAQREARVTAGLAEFSQWLNDLLRHGLGDSGGHGYALWDEAAARLVDAQAPGLARMVREIPTIVARSGTQGTVRLMERLGSIHLAVSGWHHRETLPAGLLADLRSVIGFTLKEEEVVAAGSTVMDRWWIVGQTTTEEERLHIRRTWLWGERTARPALLLTFAVGPQTAFAPTPIPGTVWEGGLIFYPSAAPLRAVQTDPGRVNTPSGLPVLSEGTVVVALEAFATILAAQPWLDRWLLRLDAVLPLRDATGWFLMDRHAHLLPLDISDSQGWLLMALCGGHPLTLFGTWDGTTFIPLSGWAEGQFSIITGA
jgi:hypothetical protein